MSLISIVKRVQSTLCQLCKHLLNNAYERKRLTHSSTNARPGQTTYACAQPYYPCTGSHGLHSCFFLIRTHLDPKVGRVGLLLPAAENSKLGVTWPLVSMSTISSNPMLLLTRIRYYSVIGCAAPSIFKKLSRWEILKKYILLVFNNYSTSARWIWVSYDYLISNKREWNNCFIKIDNSSQL